MTRTLLTGTILRSGSIPTTALPAGTITSSTQLIDTLPTGTVSSSTQVNYTQVSSIPAGIVSSSGQVSYTGLSSIPAGIVSSSGQVDVTQTTNIATLVTTGSNTFVGSQIVSGGIGIGTTPGTRPLDIDGGEVRIGQSASGTGAWLAINLTSSTTASAAVHVSLRSSASDSETIPTTQPNLILSRGSDTLGTLMKFTNQRTGFAGLGSVATANNLHDIRFYVGSGSEYMRLASTGDTTLQVQGNVSASSFTGSLAGNASTTTALQTARNINGVSFNGTGDITVTAAAGTLSGNTLASGVTASSLTSVGTLSSLTVTGDVTVDTDTLKVDSANNRVGIGTTSPAAKLELQAGAESAGANDPYAVAFAYSGGGYRHWIRTRHNSTIGSGNAIDFYVNNSASSGGSSAPTTGTVHNLTLDGGNVGIGTVSPAQKLDVVGNIQGTTGLNLTGNAARVSTTFSGVTTTNFFTDSGGGVISVDGANTFSLRNGGVSGTDRLTILGSGNVGIGVNPTNAKLEVVATSGEVFRADAAGGAYRIIANQTQVLLNGNVGIGTSSPSTRLHVAQTNAKSPTGVWHTAVFDTTSATTGVGGGITLGGYKTSTTAEEYFAGIDGYKENATGGNAAGALRFHTQPSAGSGLVERARIDSSGNLLLNGASVSAIQKFSLSATGMAVQGAVPAFALVDHNDTTNFVTYLGNTEGVAYLVNVHASSPFIFGTNDTERARITAGGYFKASDAGTYLGSTAAYHELRQSDTAASIAIMSATNASYTGAGLQLDIVRNTTDNTFYAYSYYNRTAGDFRFRVADSGNVTNTNNSYGSLSDVKLKQDITDAGSSWDDIKAVRFRKYRLKSDVAEKGDQAKYMLGVIAQELREVSPGLVDSHPDTEQVEVEVEVEKSRPVMHEVEEVVTDAEGVESVVMKSVPMLDENGKQITETYTETETRTETRKTGTETLGVKHSILLMKAAVALQEAMARIEALEAKNAVLEADIQQLKQ